MGARVERAGQKGYNAPVESYVRAVEDDSPSAAGALEDFERLTLLMRAQHILLAASCIILIVTGIPLRYPDSDFARFFFGLTQGVSLPGLLHRIGAAALIAVSAFHMAYIVFTREGRDQWRYLLPRLKDVRDVVQNVAYFFGLRRDRPRFDRYSYFEKFDYWAVYWGCVIMILSGVVLWFHEQAMRFLPKIAVDVAHEAHSDEGLLAMLAIVIWHFYNVHFNPDRFPMNWAWLTGKMSREDMTKHHPLEYERLVGSTAEGGAQEGGAEP
jgi:cytochrome b subunit of formate dehydrogenase